VLSVYTVHSTQSGNTTKNTRYSALSRFLVPQPSLILGFLQQFLFPQFHLEHIKFMPEAESLQVTCRFGLQAGVVGALSLVPGSLDCLLVHSICSLPGGLEIAEPPLATRPPGCLLPIERLALADRNFDNGPDGEDPHCGNTADLGSCIEVPPRRSVKVNYPTPEIFKNPASPALLGCSVPVPRLASRESWSSYPGL
jgi:hypothetical protein